MEESLAWISEKWTAIDALGSEEEDSLPAYMSDERPFKYIGGSVVPAETWEDLEALRKKMEQTEVCVKKSKRDNVAYFKPERNSGKHNFDPERFIMEERLPFSEFLSLAAGAAGAPGVSEGEVLYCQESMSNHPELQEEFASWGWAWILEHCKQNGWALPGANVLFMGSTGATTPAHFDEQHNFLNQVRGRKLVVLFPPADYRRMYPFPVTHPCDRCSMLDVRSPDLANFPKFAEASGHWTVLEPGEVLYIPYGWWHYCRTLTHLGASITFWSECDTEGKTELPKTFGPSEWARGRRNIEKLLMKEVGPEKLEKEVLRLLAIAEVAQANGTDGEEDERLKSLKSLCGMLQVPADEQLAFVVDTFKGRFGHDLNLFI